MLVHHNIHVVPQTTVERFYKEYCHVMVAKVARYRSRKYGRFKENSNFHAKWHTTYSKIICRNT